MTPDMTPAETHDDPVREVPLDYVPRSRPTVLALDMGDGVILYDDDSSLVHHLNHSAAIVWHLCDGSATIAQLVEDISAEFGVPVDELAPQVARTVGELEVLGLVTDAGHGAGRDGNGLRHDRDPVRRVDP